MQFKSAVGVTEEERKKKNDIVVDLSVRINTKKASRKDDIGYTVDYGVLYNTVKEIVGGGSHLLEKLAADIGERITTEHKAIKDLKVVVSKLDPPIGGTCSRASVKMRFRK